MRRSEYAMWWISFVLLSACSCVFMFCMQDISLSCVYLYVSERGKACVVLSSGLTDDSLHRCTKPSFRSTVCRSWFNHSHWSHVAARYCCLSQCAVTGRLITTCVHSYYNVTKRPKQITFHCKHTHDATFGSLYMSEACTHSLFVVYNQRWKAPSQSQFNVLFLYPRLRMIIF